MLLTKFFSLLGLAILLISCKSQVNTIEPTIIKKPEVPQGVAFIENGTVSLLMEKARVENKIIFLDFYADWCGPCKTMDKEVFLDKNVSEYFNKNFINFKVNGDALPGSELANLYNVTGYPTVVFVDPKGVVLRKQIGLIFQEQLMSLAQQSIELHRISS